MTYRRFFILALCLLLSSSQVRAQGSPDGFEQEVELIRLSEGMLRDTDKKPKPQAHFEGAWTMTHTLITQRFPNKITDLENNLLNQSNWEVRNHHAQTIIVFQRKKYIQPTQKTSIEFTKDVQGKRVHQPWHIELIKEGQEIEGQVFDLDYNRIVARYSIDDFNPNMITMRTDVDRPSRLKGPCRMFVQDSIMMICRSQTEDAASIVYTVFQRTPSSS